MRLIIPPMSRVMFMRFVLLLLITGLVFAPAVMASPSPHGAGHPCHTTADVGATTYGTEKTNLHVAAKPGADMCKDCAMMCCAPLPPFLSVALPDLPQVVYLPRPAHAPTAFKAAPPLAPPRA